MKLDNRSSRGACSALDGFDERQKCGRDDDGMALIRFFRCQKKHAEKDLVSLKEVDAQNDRK